MDENSYTRWEAYFRTKLANAVYANYLSRRLKNDGILTASVHPGGVATELLRIPQQSIILNSSLSAIFLCANIKNALEGRPDNSVHRSGNRFEVWCLLCRL